MAGQARRGERGAGRSSRAGSSWPLIAAASAVASGSDTVTSMAVARATTPVSAPELHTRATYRNLILRGLAPDEAANLTAYLAGITVGETNWTLRQINQLLFLREMNRSGQFAEAADSTGRQRLAGAAPALTAGRAGLPPTFLPWRRTLLPAPRPSVRSGAYPPPGAASARPGQAPPRPSGPLPSLGMSGPFISFLTDFGPDGPAAVCRGVMLAIAPDASIVDIAHGVRKFAIRDGAILFASALPYFRVGVAVGVVDPGVGTERLPIAIRTERGDLLVGPDNGLFRPVAPGARRHRRGADPREPRPLASLGHVLDVPRPRHLQPGRRPSRDGNPVRERGSGDRRGRSRPARGCRRPPATTAGWRPGSSTSTASATPASPAGRTTWPVPSARWSRDGPWSWRSATAASRSPSPGSGPSARCPSGHRSSTRIPRERSRCPTTRRASPPASA